MVKNIGLVGGQVVNNKDEWPKLRKVSSLLVIIS